MFLSVLGDVSSSVYNNRSKFNVFLCKHVFYFCLAVHRFGVRIVIEADFQDTDSDLQSRRMMEIKEEVPSVLFS